MPLTKQKIKQTCTKKKKKIEKSDFIKFKNSGFSGIIIKKIKDNLPQTGKNIYKSYV